MAFYKGINGFISTGGVLVGAPEVNGALSAAAVTLNIKVASGNLVGVVSPGDTFTIAGETGSPVHTVTNTVPVSAVTNAVAGVTFTPAIATGGTADGAVITFASNIMAQASAWDSNIAVKDLDTTSLGDKWASSVTEIASWSGTITVRLDYGLAPQAKLINRLTGATPGGIQGGVQLGIDDSSTGTAYKAFIGAALFKSGAVQDQIGKIVEVKIAFVGVGQLSLLWA